MPVAFPYDSGASNAPSTFATPFDTQAPASQGVTELAPDITDDMITAGTGRAPEGTSPEEAFGKVTDGRTLLQELGEGYARGQEQTQSMVTMGMETLASAMGFDAAANRFREQSELHDRRAAQHPVSVGSYTDVQDFESGAKYALGVLGEQAPQLAMDAAAAIGTGGIAAIGTVAFRKGVTAAIAKEVFKKGAWRGMAASQYAQNTGESRKMQLAEGIDSPTAAMTTAVGKTVLDYASAKIMLRSALTLAGRGMRAEAMQLIKEGTRTSAVEGITEGMQAMVDHVAIAAQKTGYRIDTPEVAEDVINSAIVGILVGGTPATIHATLKAVQKTGKFTTDMLSRKDATNDSQTPTESDAQTPAAAAPTDGAVPSVSEVAPLQESQSADVPFADTTQPVDGGQNAEPNQQPAPVAAPAPETTAPNAAAGPVDVPQNRQDTLLWATRRERVSDNAGMGMADDGAGVPAAAATAHEQSSLITEEQRNRAAAIADYQMQHTSWDKNGPITEEPPLEPDTVYERGAVKQQDTRIITSAIPAITRANDARRTAAAVDAFTSAENAPAERADNRELGAAEVAPVDFLNSQNMATSENDTAELFSNDAKQATSEEVNSVLDSFLKQHNEQVGGFSVTDSANRDAETDSIFSAVRRGVEKAQRSLTRTRILQTNAADPRAAEELDVPAEKLMDVRNAARRDQNSTYVKNPEQDFVFFRDEKNPDNTFPVYLPDAVVGVLASPHSTVSKSAGDSRTKVAAAIGDIISAMANEGYHPVTTNAKGETVPFADAYANTPVAYVGKTALGTGNSKMVTLADLSNPETARTFESESQRERYAHDEIVQLNRAMQQEEKLLLLRKALTHFTSKGLTNNQQVAEVLKKRITSLEQAASLRGISSDTFAADAANDKAKTARTVLDGLRSLAGELKHADAPKVEVEIARVAGKLDALDNAVKYGPPARDVLEGARAAVAAVAAAQEAQKNVYSTGPADLHNMLELLDSKLAIVRQEEARRPEAGTNERLAENKPDAETTKDPYESTANPVTADYNSALFALRRNAAADERLAASDATERLTTFRNGRRVPPRKADVEAHVAEVKANMQRVGAAVEAKERTVISSDAMLSAGGLIDRLDKVARDVGITGKIAVVMGRESTAAASVAVMDDGALISVNPAWFATASVEAREALLSHELGHVVTAQIISAADPKVLQRLAADFNSYRAGLDAIHPYNKNEASGFDEYLADQFAAYLRNREKKAVASSGRRGGIDAIFADIKRKLEKLVAAISKFIFGTDRLTGTKVGFQFMESMFAAAHNSRRGASGSPEFYEAWMRQVYDSPNRAMRDRKATAEAAGLKADGKLATRDFDLNRARDTAGGIVNGVVGALKNPMETGRRLAAAADRLHREIPIFITAREELKGISKELMRKYDKVFDGSRSDIDAWQQRVHRIFNAIHADANKQQLLADYINGRAELPRELKTYLSDLYKHLKTDMPTINELRDYFPRMYDLEALNSRRDEFLEMLKTEGKMSEAEANNIWHNIVNGKNLYTAEIAPEVSVHGSTMQNAKVRMLPNISDEALRQHGFLQNDIQAVLLHYTQKSVRMKHYARQFAQYTSLRHPADVLREFLPDVMIDDSDSTKARNRKMLSWMLRDKVPLFDLQTGLPLGEKEKMRQIKEPSDDDDFIRMNMPFIKQAIDQQWIIPEERKGQLTFAFYDMNAGLRDIVKALPTEQQRRVSMIVDAYEGRLAADKLSPTARNVMSNIVAYQNLRTMLFSTFTSLADASGLVFKGGDFRGALANLKDIGSIIGELRRGDKLQLYRDLGYAERQTATQAFMEAYGIQHQSKLSAKINNALFTWNGQIALTNGIRLMGAALAERHMQRAAKDLRNGTEAQKDNARAMFEDLGITASDAEALHDDYKRYNSYVDSGDTTSAEAQRAFRLHEAVNKYVDSAITRPDARARPVWGSDPRFMLLYQFKSFIFAYWEKIMKPVLAESARRYSAGQGGRAAKAAAAAAPLAVFVLPTFALSALGLWLRQILQYEVWGDEAPAKQMELPEYTYEVIKRGGILGPFEMGFSFVENNAEGRSGVTQLMGPTASHLELLLKGDMERSMGASTPVFSQIPALREWAKGMLQ